MGYKGKKVMSYIHCHSCFWSQDDFYSKGYNPADFLRTWNEYLFGDKRNKLDTPFSDDSQFLSENGPITAREVIARDYENFAKRIREMKWVTHDDFIRDPNKTCPACGSKNLDID